MGDGKVSEADQHGARSCPTTSCHAPRPATCTDVLFGTHRVAEQKNLHTLLFSLWLLRHFRGDAPKITLDVFGGESNSGSPMMGMRYPGYAEYLCELVESLGLTDVVTWQGAKPRDWLFYNVHLEPYIFVHPTLLSDENFGASVLASLANGHQVVTTEWGGPRGWRKWFPGQLTLVPVRRSPRGPVVHPVSLADAVLKAVGRMATVVAGNADLDQARVEFSESSVAPRTSDLLDQPHVDPAPLKKSPLLEHLDDRRARFGGDRQIYEDYEDPAAQFFFEAYGMDEPLVFDEDASYVLVPWTSRQGQVLHVDDPHRGPQRLRIDEEGADPVDVTACPSLSTCRLPKDLVRKLAEQGYAFPITSAHG